MWLCWGHKWAPVILPRGRPSHHQSKGKICFLVHSPYPACLNIYFAPRKKESDWLLFFLLLTDGPTLLLLVGYGRTHIPGDWRHRQNRSTSSLSLSSGHLNMPALVSLSHFSGLVTKNHLHRTPRKNLSLFPNLSPRISITSKSYPSHRYLSLSLKLISISTLIRACVGLFLICTLAICVCY